MAEYIDKDLLLKDVGDKLSPIYEAFRRVINSQPIADVAMTHGKWLDNVEYVTTLAGVKMRCVVGYKCSLCGRTEIKKEPYCNCGAKMDLE